MICSGLIPCTVDTLVASENVGLGGLENAPRRVAGIISERRDRVPGIILPRVEYRYVHTGRRRRR
jgi:hypothetical protein